MKNANQKKWLSLFLSLAMVAAMALSVIGCSSTSTTEAPAETAVTETTAEVETASEAPQAADEAAAGEELGEGALTFTFVVKDAEANQTLFTIHTDAETVGEALLDLGLIEGEDGEYGLYVKTVNGITADYDTDGVYWAFYIDGEYAMTGVDATEVTDGAEYTFAVEE